MLLRIKPGQARLGMYIHGFDGGWFSHPFWRSRFHLTDPADLAKVRDSDVAAVVIDVSKGPGPDEAPPPAAATDHRDAPSRITYVGPVRAAPQRAADRAKAAQDRDHALARETVGRAKRVMKQVFDGARLGRAIRSADVVSVVDDISASLDHNRHALIGVTRLKAKHEYTYLHSVAVCALMVNFARELGMDEAATRELGMAGLLHDVGKMAVSDAILDKPGPLTDEEFAEIRHHTSRGHALLSESDAVPDVALDVCLHHHEKIDGSGYPFRLGGDEISLSARMGAICDVYDAMTSNRSYKVAWKPVETIAAMRSWEGHFDPVLLFRFMRSVGIYPVGTLVRLRSNLLAVALDNGRRASRPRFRAFYAVTDRAFVPVRDVQIADDLSGDQVIEEADPTTFGFADWPAMCERIVAGQPPLAAAA
ncbi:HD-GYP domain-containing protein [Sphingomonas sp. SUN019]|uniref:HD-GYP domain-containing protein n=1 Tax=Sphingomonas sp. SUN019 TaxID=2937788 RepID=UPI0021645E18|nr:HD-GYP domain-containing protein [Sphingomonas sp. SUN019]UVO49573.1 HD-GYP domain-containing protein [Sphingomonas sp. SUN019]